MVMTDKMNNNDNDLIEKKIDSKNVFDGHLLHVRCDSVRLPNGNVTTREWVKHPGAAAVLPILPDGRVILVRQYRYPVQRVTLEIPAGKLDSPDENPLDCAKRELAEETGYHALDVEKILTLATTVGFSNEFIHIYTAKGLVPGKQHTDDDEFIHVAEVPLEKAYEMVQNGEIIDAKTIAAILWEFARR